VTVVSGGTRITRTGILGVIGVPAAGCWSQTRPGVAPQKNSSRRSGFIPKGCSVSFASSGSIPMTFGNPRAPGVIEGLEGAAGLTGGVWPRDRDVVPLNTSGSNSPAG